MNLTRRQFLATAAGSAAAGLLTTGHQTQAGGPHLKQTEIPEPVISMPLTLPGNRFLTFNSVIRVNQIEAARDKDVGHDESAIHKPEAAAALRKALAAVWPSARMTWAYSWKALHDPRPNYQAIRKLTVQFHNEYGDEITFLPGAFFANMYNTRAQVNRDLRDGLARVSELVGGGYRPQAVVAGFLAAANHQYLAEHENIHVCQGNVWSQYAIDNGDGDGSICYPYYPSTEHFCKPAQGKADFIDCVTLDGWTCDFVSARRAGVTRQYNSRMGVGPIECLMQGRMSKDDGLKEMLATTAAHFDQGYALNRFGWVTSALELSLSSDEVVGYMSQWWREIRRRWPEAKFPTFGEFGQAWRAENRDNQKLDYRFTQRGTGIHGSDANLEVRWFMNRDFRLALLRDWQAGGPAQVIDFTRYDLKAEEPRDLQRNWSLMNRLNQKGRRPQDKPMALAALSEPEQALIGKHYPELLG